MDQTQQIPVQPIAQQVPVQQVPVQQVPVQEVPVVQQVPVQEVPVVQGVQVNQVVDPNGGLAQTAVLPEAPKPVKATNFFIYIFEFIGLGFSSIMKHGSNAFNPKSINY